MTHRTAKALTLTMLAGHAFAIDFGDAEQLAIELEPEALVLGIDLDEGVFEVEMARSNGEVQIELEFDSIAGRLLKREVASFGAADASAVRRILEASIGILTFDEAIARSGVTDVDRIDLEFEDQGLVFDIERMDGSRTRVLASGGSGSGGSGDGSSGDDSSGSDGSGSGDDDSFGGAGSVSDAAVIDAILAVAVARPDDLAWRVRLDDVGVVRVDVVDPVTFEVRRVDVVDGSISADQAQVNDEPEELRRIVSEVGGAITFAEALDEARVSMPNGDLERLALKIEDGRLIYEARFVQGRVRIDALSGGTARVRRGSWSESSVGGQLDRRAGDDVRASMRRDGSLFGTWVNASGEVVLVERDDSGWSARLFDDDSTSPARVLALPADDSSRAFASVSTTTSLLLLDSTSSGGRDLVQEIPGSTPIVSEMTSFSSIDGVSFIGGFDASGDAVVYWQTGQLDVDGAELWAFTNLTRDHLEPQGIAIPAMASDLVSYVTPWNGLNIAYLDEAGEVWSIWWSPGMSRWTASNLSVLTGAAPMASGLSAYVTPWGGINLAGLDASGDVVVTWWSPALQDQWASNNLSREFGHPGLSRGELTSYVTPWGGQNIAGLDDDGELVVYWWAPGMNEWIVSPLSSLVPDAMLPASSISAVAQPDGMINLFGFSNDDDLVRYYWTPGGSWELERVIE